MVTSESVFPVGVQGHRRRKRKHTLRPDVELAANRDGSYVTSRKRAHVLNGRGIIGKATHLAKNVGHSASSAGNTVASSTVGAAKSVGSSITSAATSTANTVASSQVGSQIVDAGKTAGDVVTGKASMKEIGSAVGGMTGAEIGSSLAVGAALALGQPELVPVAAVGGAYVGGQIGSMAGKQGGHMLYKATTGRSVHTPTLSTKTAKTLGKALTPDNAAAFAGGELGSALAESAVVAAGHPELIGVAGKLGGYAGSKGVNAVMNKANKFDAQASHHHRVTTSTSPSTTTKSKSQPHGRTHLGERDKTPIPGFEPPSVQNKTVISAPPPPGSSSSSYTPKPTTTSTDTDSASTTSKTTTKTSKSTKLTAAQREQLRKAVLQGKGSGRVY